jgi:hypothetical protein
MRILQCSFVTGEHEDWQDKEQNLPEFLKWLTLLMEDMSSPPYIETSGIQLYMSFRVSSYENWKAIVIGDEIHRVSAILNRYQDLRFNRATETANIYGCNASYSALVNIAILETFRFEVTKQYVEMSTSELINLMLLPR